MGVKRTSSHWLFLNSTTSMGLIQPGRDGWETVRYQTWGGKSASPWEFATEKSSVSVWVHVVTCGCYILVTSRIFWYLSAISLNPMLQTCINPLLWVLFKEIRWVSQVAEFGSVKKIAPRLLGNGLWNHQHLPSRITKSDHLKLSFLPGHTHSIS